MILPVNLGPNSYEIVVEPGCLSRIGTLLNLNRRCLVVTDSGVPAVYAKTVADACESPVLVTIPQGEASKNLDQWQKLLKVMLDNDFTRTDCVVAVGGGVVGDLSGFAAASYMRGIDFYNIPTTLLSQVDSSVGGKTGVDFAGVKNIVGAFYQPKKVIIDPDVLHTLDARLVAEGMAEAIKMAATSDATLFADLESGLWDKNPSEVIARAVSIKIDVVEQDERESGLRRILNFGHTLGHGIESEQNGALYHGECVALGMIPLAGDAAAERIRALLTRFGLPTTYSGNRETAFAACLHDKKFRGTRVSCVFVPDIGHFDIRSLSAEDLHELLNKLN